MWVYARLWKCNAYFIESILLNEPDKALKINDVDSGSCSLLTKKSFGKKGNQMTEQMQLVSFSCNTMIISINWKHTLTVLLRFDREPLWRQVFNLQRDITPNVSKWNTQMSLISNLFEFLQVIRNQSDTAFNAHLFGFLLLFDSNLFFSLLTSLFLKEGTMRLWGSIS